MQTQMKLTHKVPLVMDSRTSLSQSGISGRKEPAASATTPVATVPSITSSTQSAPPSGLKWPLSSLYPFWLRPALPLITLAAIIGGMNITG